jgi:hypothetical protein
MGVIYAVFVLMLDPIQESGVLRHTPLANTDRFGGTMPLQSSA